MNASILRKAMVAATAVISLTISACSKPAEKAAEHGAETTTEAAATSTDAAQSAADAAADASKAASDAMASSSAPAAESAGAADVVPEKGAESPPPPVEDQAHAKH